MKLDDAAARLEALGNPTRLRIYRALVKAGDNGLSVGKLQAKLDIAASTLSHHLKALIVVGLVTLASLLAARMLEATHIVAIDMNDAKLAVAREFGATATVNAADPQAAARVR